MSQSPRSLADQVKARLIQKGLEKRLQQIADAPANLPSAPGRKLPDAFTRFDRQPGYQQVKLMQEGGQRLGVESPFFHVHAGTASAHSEIQMRRVINYGSYNYLDLSGDARVNAAAQAAIDQYGTSVSAQQFSIWPRALFMGWHHHMNDSAFLDVR